MKNTGRIWILHIYGNINDLGEKFIIEHCNYLYGNILYYIY